MEHTGHFLVYFKTLHRNQVGRDTLAGHLAVLDCEIDLPMPDKPAVASRINQAKSVTLNDFRPVVVGTDKEVNSRKRLHQVETLALKDSPIT